MFEIQLKWIVWIQCPIRLSKEQKTYFPYIFFHDIYIYILYNTNTHTYAILYDSNQPTSTPTHIN